MIVLPDSYEDMDDHTKKKLDRQNVVMAERQNRSKMKKAVTLAKTEEEKDEVRQ